MSTNRDVKELHDELSSRGWKIEKRSNGHYKYVHPPSGNFMFGASTPSDTRSIDNERARAKKIEKQHEGTYGQHKEGERREKKSRLARGRRIEYAGDPRDAWPNLPNTFNIEAVASADGTYAKVLFPDDFAGMRVFLSGEPRRRKLVLTTDPTGLEIKQGLMTDEACLSLPLGFIDNVRPGTKSFWDGRRINGEILCGTVFDFMSRNFAPEKKEVGPYRSPRPIIGVIEKLPSVTPPTEEKEPPMANNVLKLKTTEPEVDENEGNVELLKQVCDRIGYGGYSAVNEMLGYSGGQVIKNWINEGKMPVVAYRLLKLLEATGATATAKPKTREERIREAFSLVNDAVRHDSMKLKIMDNGQLTATIVTEVSF